MKIKTLVSFIIVTYNHSEELIINLISNILSMQPYCPLFEFEIVLINNGDLTYDITSCKTFNNIIHVKTNTNLGYCGGNNYGMHLANGKSIIICNPDITFKESLCIDWLVSYSLFKNAIVGSYRDGITWLTYPSMFPTDRIYEADELPFVYFENPITKYPEQQWKSMPFVDGSLMCFPRHLYTSVISFDDDIFPGYFGENTFQFKAHLSGYKTINVPISNLYSHNTNSDNQYTIDQKIKWTKDARSLFYQKYAIPHYKEFLNYLV